MFISSRCITLCGILKRFQSQKITNRKIHTVQACISFRLIQTYQKMNQMTVLVTHSDIPQVGIDLLRQHHLKIITNGELPIPTKEEIIAKVKGVDAIFWSPTNRLDKDIIDAAGPNLKVVATMSVGFNHIDVDYLKSKGIKLGNTPNILTDSVSEVAIMLAMAAAKRLTEGRRLIESGKWIFGPQYLLGQELRGSTIGIVGFGGIGQMVAKKLYNAFNVDKVLYSGHREKPEAKAINADFVPLDKLLQQSDFVFATLPLNNETRDLFDFSKFAQMKPSAVFVNVSRGEIVKQDDLVEALKKKVIFGAGLDVMTPEPLPKDHVLLQLDNCVLTPHIGSASDRTRNDMSKLTAENIIAGLKNEKLPASVY